MNTKTTLLFFGIVSLILSGCGSRQMVAPTITPTPTQTLVPLDSSKVYIEGNISWLNPQKPMGNAVIDLYVVESSTPIATTKTDTKGHYVFVNVEPIKQGFGFNITIPISELVCYKPEILYNKWFASVLAFQPSEEWAKVWLQNNTEAKVPTGEIVYMDIVLKCP